MSESRCDRFAERAIGAKTRFSFDYLSLKTSWFQTHSKINSILFLTKTELDVTSLRETVY